MSWLRRTLEAAYTPQWAGGWLVMRWLWVVAATIQHGSDVLSIPDVWGAQDMVFVTGPWRLAEHFLMTPSMAYGLWATTMLGIACVAFGGRALRPGLVLWAIGAWTFLGYEALNVKAHDRMFAWVSLGLFLSPAHERGLTDKWRSPFARWFLIVVYSAIYGITGWNKALHEPSWWTDGVVLGQHFLHFHHGLKPLGIWLSGQAWLLPVMTITTVLWESLFPLLIWSRRLNPIVLALGVLFHTTLLLTMSVGPFAIVMWSAYPVLLQPELARTLWLRLEGWYSGAPASTPRA